MDGVAATREELMRENSEARAVAKSIWPFDQRDRWGRPASTWAMTQRLDMQDAFVIGWNHALSTVEEEQ